MDTKQWGSWRALFTDSAEFYFDDMTEPAVIGADQFVEMVSQQLNDSVTVHQGHMPELTFVDDRHATGIWAMFDWVDGSARGAMQLVGYGHYHESYVKGDDGTWRIEKLRLTRLRTDTTVHVGKVADDQAPWKAS
jgi:hypothetical protein